MEKSKPKTISQNRLKRVFQDIREQNSKEIRFCFVIGAGASKSSGIKTGWELSEEWYKELKNDLTAEELQAWKDNIAGNFDEDNIGAYYSDLYKTRYEVEPETGYNTLTALMEKAEPGIGYTILAHILTQERHNFVITTNFDYLIEDSIRMFTSKKPLVAGHETLAEFVSSQTERPTIIKVHRDLLLHPFNNGEETGTLKAEWQKTLAPILKNFRLIVLGYGGNDGSLMDYLRDMDVAQRKSIYWCVRDPKKDINNKIDNVLTDKDFIVSIQGFDEFMIMLYDVLKYDFFDNLDKPDEHVFVKSAQERIVKLNNQRNRLLEPLEDKQDIPQEAKSLFKNASEYMYNAYKEKDIDKKNKIYQNGLKAYPKDADLLGAYAVFLEDTQEDYNQAEKYYKQAIEVDPKYAKNLGNYAAFLHDTKKDYDEAEKYYKQAIKADPKHANNLSNYALFLHAIRNGYDEAEKYYIQAIKASSNHANSYMNLGFLYLQQGQLESAEEMTLKAVKLGELDVGNMNLGHIYFVKGDIEKAFQAYKTSLHHFKDITKFFEGYDEDYQYLKQYNITQEAYANMKQRLKAGKGD